VIILKKQQNNISLAIKIFANSLLKLLSLIIVILAISGGDSFAYERTRYNVIVARPGKNVTTQLRVYAENLEEARENVALNGWQILSIEEYKGATDGSMRGATADAGTSYMMSVTKIGEGEVEPSGDISVASGDSLMLSFKPGPCEKISKVIFNGTEVVPSGATQTFDGISKDGYAVVIFDKNGSECSDNGIFSKDLSEVVTIYFALGEFKKQIPEDKMQIINSVAADKEYVIIGHTDDVRVIPNKMYEDNFQLSVKRAKYLMDKLTKAGISADKIKIVGLGPAFPVAENMKEGQPLNRRAVLYERR